MSRMTDKVVCITGAGRGLGAALARAFDAEGARLSLAARTAPEIDDLAGEMRDAISVQTDVRSPREIAALVEATVGEFGRLDVMINNAGLAIYGPVGSYTADEIDLIIDTNVKGVIYGSQAAFEVMKSQRAGFIVNIGSVAGKMHLPNESVYAASKWAVSGYTGTLWLEARKHGVRVCNVCPGGIATPFWSAQEFLPFPDKFDPQRDFMKPEEVAQSVVDLVATTKGYCVSEVVMQPVLF
ncbi:MAG: SDR family oxidoreductase [Proteobacteria bacterium]|nr:SDR family oxidoreductase [Pseudomonadota bacterium]MCP4916738.1 SDR family oxidoreductase [Pseudomonadota bacterium]